MSADCPECVPSPWWHLFDSSPFMPRYRCGEWPEWLIWAWVIPSVLLFFTYMAVAVWGIRKWSRMRGTDFPRWTALSIAMLFSACGVGHAVNASSFWWPGYRFFIAWDWYTAFASAYGWYGLRKVYRYNEEKRLRALTADDEKLHYVAYVDSEKHAKEKLQIALRMTESERDAARDRLATAQLENDMLRARLGLQLGGA